MIAEDIDRQASDWLIRRSEGMLPAAEEQSFQRWIADPRHERAYRSLQQIWGDIAELKHLGHSGPAQQTGEPASTGEAAIIAKRAATRLGTRWPRVVALAATLAIAVIGAVLLVRTPPDATVATNLAEIREVVLPDGSMVTLGAQSELDFVFDTELRRATLRNGEAFFSVVRDASRPFVVEAGDARIRVVGTQFAVRCGTQAVRVSVVEGRVEVSERPRLLLGSSSADPPRVLTAGQRTEVREPSALSGARAGVTSPPEVAVSEEDVAAWRFGRLVYEDQRLEDLVADVNRYYPPGIELAQADIGTLRVTAAFRTDEIPQTITALERALPLAAEHQSNGRIVLRLRSPAP